MNADERLLPVGDGAIGKVQELGAAAAHLDGDVAESGAVELEARRLAMIRTADRLQFTGGAFLKLLDRHP